VVGVGVVHAGGRDVVELLAGTGLRFRDVDDVEDLRAAEAGDLHSTHEGWSAAGAACPAADDVACVASQPASTFRPSSDADPGTAV
jgi:hypothetical protein